MTHQVFLSHAREDQAAASHVCEMLEADGVQCWLGVRDLPEDSDRAAAVLEAIRGSDLVLLLFSASANTSATVLREIERAIAYERPVLSIHLDDAVPNASLEYYLNLWQWLDASRGGEGTRDDILAAVRAQLAGTADSVQWGGVDAREGVDGKREEILSAVRAQLAQATDSAADREPGPTLTSPTSWGRLSRRTWGIAAGGALLVLALGLGLGLGLTGTTHQGTWTRLAPTGTVPHAPTAPITYDSTTRRVILMTGSGDDLDVPTAIDTWAYDPVANSWTQLPAAGTVPPPIIVGPAMNYDPTAQRLIMFGGGDRPATQTRGGAWVHYPTAGTWAFDPVANTWTDLKPTGTVPPVRLEGATAYDPATQRLILFGGLTTGPAGYELVPLRDTWAYDSVANTWTELKPAGARPPARSSKMVYDSTSGRMIMFGSAVENGALNDTWAYDPVANIWTELKPSGALPEKRLGFGIVYDSSSHRVVMFGGCNVDQSQFYNDVWAYDPVANTWTEFAPSGALPRACIASMVYDEATERIIMFAGGGPGEVVLNDIWVFSF